MVVTDVTDEKRTVVRERRASPEAALTAVNAYELLRTNLLSFIDTHGALRMKAKGKFLVLSFLLGIALAVPGVAGAQNYPDSIKQMVGAAKKQIKTINMEQFKAGFDKKELGLIVDVRNPDEFAAGHIPGAVNVSRGLLEFTIWDQVGYPDKTDMNKKMTLHCKTGGRCALATKTLQDLGFTNVQSADVKIEEWIKAGYPIVKPRP
jgi:rhodanese-related sulfurtransferase